MFGLGMSEEEIRGPWPDHNCSRENDGQRGKYAEFPKVYRDGWEDET